MLSVVKNYTDIPVALRSDKCLEENERLYQQDFEGLKLGKIYSDDSVRVKLKSIYGNKCSYCESALGVSGYLQVEHYRPKAGVKENAEHKGYYWLRNNWGNLLLACELCNRKKGTYFPLGCETKRIYRPPDEISHHEVGVNCQVNMQLTKYEAPILLNPEQDKMTDHIKFTLNGGVVGKTNRGIKTIEFLRLDRGQLVRMRRKIQVEHTRALRKTRRRIIESSRPTSECMKELRHDLLVQLKQLRSEIIDIEEVYRGFRVALYKNYVDFVIKPVCGEKGAFFEFCRDVVLKELKLC